MVTPGPRQASPLLIRTLHGEVVPAPSGLPVCEGVTRWLAPGRLEVCVDGWRKVWKANADGFALISKEQLIS